MLFFENKNSLFHVRKHKGGWFNRHRCFARDKKRSKGKRNHDHILKQFYTHRHSIQCLVQLSPPPMPFFLAGKCYVSSLWSYSKDTIRAGCDNGKGGIVAVLRQRPREKFRFVSGSGFFFTVASLNRVRACTCMCGRSCIVHGGRAALDKSPFDVCLSDFEWNGNRGWRKQGGRRSRKYHFSWYHTLLSCLAFATDYERKGLLNRGLEISNGTKKKKEKIYLFFQRCENNFDEFSCVLEDFIRHSTKICLPEWESSERRNVSRVEQSRHWTVGETLIWKLIS